MAARRDDDRLAQAFGRRAAELERGEAVDHGEHAAAQRRQAGDMAARRAAPG